MIYLCNSEGLIVASVPSAVNQGSVGVNEIVLIAPFPSTSVVSLAFTLPNGVLVHPQALPHADSAYPYNMALADSFSGQLTGGYNVWTMKLDKALTQVAGTARISFFITSADGETVSTPSTQLSINKSAGFILNVTTNDLNTLASYIAAANAAAQNAQEALEAFQRENYFDVAISGTTFPVGMPEDVIQAELQNLLLEASGNVLIKDLAISGIQQSYYTKGDTVLSVPYGDGKRLIIPNAVNRIVFSNCTFKGVSLIGDYNEGAIEGQYVIDNTTEIQILPPVVNLEYATENVVTLLLFGSVRNSVVDTIYQCFNVDNCVVKREITECINVTNCSGFHFITGTGTQVSGATIRNCQYVDLHSLFAMTFDNSGGTTVNLDGMVMTLGNSTTEGRIRPLPQRIAGSIAASTLTLELKDKNGNTISSASVALPLSSIYRYVGSVSTFEDLPANSQVGDVYNVESAYGNYPAGTNFAWNGTTWDALGGSVDLSEYLTKGAADSTFLDKIDAKSLYVALPSDSSIHRRVPVINTLGELYYSIISNGVGADTVPLRDAHGNMSVNLLTRADHCLSPANFANTDYNRGIIEHRTFERGNSVVFGKSIDSAGHYFVSGRDTDLIITSANGTVKTYEGKRLYDFYIAFEGTSGLSTMSIFGLVGEKVTVTDNSGAVKDIEAYTDRYNIRNITSVEVRKKETSSDTTAVQMVIEKERPSGRPIAQLLYT